MNVQGVKAAVRGRGGEVTDTEYDEGGGSGNSNATLVEAYFRDSESVPKLNRIELCDRCLVDYNHDSENNGVMITVDF